MLPLSIFFICPLIENKCTRFWEISKLKVKFKFWSICTLARFWHESWKNKHSFHLKTLKEESNLVIGLFITHSVFSLTTLYITISTLTCTVGAHFHPSQHMAGRLSEVTSARQLQNKKKRGHMRNAFNALSAKFGYYSKYKKPRLENLTWWSI